MKLGTSIENNFIGSLTSYKSQHISNYSPVVTNLFPIVKYSLLLFESSEESDEFEQYLGQSPFCIFNTSLPAVSALSEL